MIKKSIFVMFLFVNVLVIGCGGGSVGTDQNAAEIQALDGTAPELIAAEVIDDDLSLHVPPQVWTIGDFMRFEATYSDVDGDADSLELMIYDQIGCVYAGPYYFELDPGAGWYHTDRDQVVEGVPGFYNLEFKIVDKNGNESDVFKAPVRFKF